MAGTARGWATARDRQPRRALVLASRPNRKPFDTLDLELASVFAWPAAEALTLIGFRDVERRMDTAEDRNRIARSLHDVVLQRLFAIGLYLDRVAPSVSGSVADSLNVATTELSATINEIRATIFSLHAAAISGPTLRDELLDIAMRGCETLGFDVHLNLEGSVDRTIPTLPGHLRATLEEALTAIARQGSASRVDVLVRADHDQLSLQIHANGDLLPADDREAMLADGLRRISSLGGSLDIGSASDDHGTILAWQVPIPSEAATAG